MVLKTVALAGSLLVAATDTHDHIGPHGGQVADVGRYHVELVAKGSVVELYVSDSSEKPVPTTGFKATAILVVDGKPARIALEPADGNRLSGRAAAALTGTLRGAVQLTAPDGATASGKFN